MLVASLGLLLVLAGATVLLGSNGSRAGSGPVPASDETEAAPSYEVEPITRIQQDASTPDPAAGRPTRIVVGGLGVDAPVVPIDLDGATLLPPADPQVIGWWSGGAKPGALHGAAVLTGHTVHTGGGAFDHLDTVRPGEPVSVRTALGTVRYQVEAITVYRRASLARHAARVFGQHGPGRLVLVTCDDWNGREYLSNAVVLATPRSS